jgi:6-hydroxycyclohex-1-ene-1-carbonyl-CoA dehydrogenase
MKAMNKLATYQMTALDQPFELVTRDLPTPDPDEALIEVAGCGICHTDISFWHYSVPVRHELPLTLGHEISGTVVEGPPDLVGQAVIVPAVLACGDCDLCTTGRSNICRQQKMPGNDFHGGFASHVLAPARYLAPVDAAALKNHSLAELAVIADAVSTPYQVVQKSGLRADDFAIIIGAGGIGTYACQIAQSMGAKVLALDIAEERLEALAQVGITETLNIANLDIKTAKAQVKECCKTLDAAPHSWQIYETSGTKPGQELAFALLGYAATLSIVGFTMDKLELRLSNLMAFDGKVIGTWGCRPELYPNVIKLVAEGKVQIKPFVETCPMSRINEVFADTLQHKFTKRSILLPDFN